MVGPLPLEQNGRVVQPGGNDFERSVVVEVSCGQPPEDSHHLKVRPHLLGKIFKLSISGIVIVKAGLLVTCSRLIQLNVVGNVRSGDQEILPTIIVEIGKLRAPSAMA